MQKKLGKDGLDAFLWKISFVLTWQGLRTRLRKRDSFPNNCFSFVAFLFRQSSNFETTFARSYLLYIKNNRFGNQKLCKMFCEEINFEDVSSIFPSSFLFFVLWNIDEQTGAALGKIVTEKVSKIKGWRITCFLLSYFYCPRISCLSTVSSQSSLQRRSSKVFFGVHAPL